MTPAEAKKIVLVSPGGGKCYHSGSCGQGRERITMREAVEAGYTECIKCMSIDKSPYRFRLRSRAPTYEQWSKKRAAEGNRDV